MNNATTSTLMMIRQNFPHLGIELPTELVADLAEVDRIFTGRDIFNSRRHDLAEAVVTALAAGKDPAADKTVTTLLVREQMRLMNLDDELAAVAEGRRANALRGHADVIIEALSDVIDRADVTLAEARDRIPSLDLTNADAVRSMAPDQMALWGRAREALDHVGRVAKLWAMLVGACDLCTVPPHRRPLVIAELSLSDLMALGHQPNATAAVLAGHRLSLATPATFAERLARLEDDRALEAGSRERAFTDAFRALHSTGQPA